MRVQTVLQKHYHDNKCEHHPGKCGDMFNKTYSYLEWDIPKFGKIRTESYTGIGHDISAIQHLKELIDGYQFTEEELVILNGIYPYNDSLFLNCFYKNVPIFKVGGTVVNLLWLRDLILNE